jgi:hypothetical protein
MDITETSSLRSLQKSKMNHSSELAAPHSILKKNNEEGFQVVAI